MTDDVQTSSWIVQNISWLIPMCITFVFSIVNIIFAIINAHNAKEQYKAQQIELGVALMQNRLEIYQIEQRALISIINYDKPDAKLNKDLCRADIEIRYLFGSDIYNHFCEVMNLVEKANDYVKPAIPDGLGGFFSDVHDNELEMISQEAESLMGKSIDLYNKYIDFSETGIIKKRNNNAKKNKAKT